MARHISLDLPVHMPETVLLEFRERMAPNERCWCRSGLKWKKCHKNREQMTPIPFGKRQADMRAGEIARGRCLHPHAGDECSDKIIRAHTVQRSRGLSSIAENGHVLSFKEAARQLAKTGGAYSPLPVGVRNASTFFGFCNEHDTSMFAPVEKGWGGLSAESCFLLSFRALCYEYLAKEMAIEEIKSQRNGDAGLSFIEQYEYQSNLTAYLHGTEIAYDELKRFKTIYDEMFEQKDYKKLCYYAISFEKILPILGCGGFHPEVDFHGNRLQHLMRATDDYEHVFFNLMVLDGRTVMVIAWLGTNGPAEDFVSSLARLADARKADAVLRLAVEHLENIYLRPSWWEGLPPSTQSRLIKRFRSGMPAGRDRNDSALAEDGMVVLGDVPLVATGPILNP